MTSIELVEVENFKGKTIEDFPKAEEYFENIVAYDEDETEAMCDYLENKEKKEKAE